MGLDMYLTGKRYLRHSERDSKNFNILKEFTGGREPIEVTFELCYWRKANAIHNWFVNNVQDGVDNCAEYVVDYASLVSLRDACKEALDNKNPYILKPTSGFFFGSTEVDDYYWEEIKRTFELFVELTQEQDIIDGKTVVYYQSSW